MKKNYYEVVNVYTKELKFKSVSEEKAEEIKARLEKASPSAKFEIVIVKG